jgi:hypothetical protein
MKGQKTCLNFLEDTIYFPNGISLTLNDIQGAEFIKDKPFNETVHLVLEATGVVDEKGKLNFKILEYNAGEGSFPNEISEMELVKVEAVSFKGIDTNSILKLRKKISSKAPLSSSSFTHGKDSQSKFHISSENTYEYNQIQKVKIQDLNFRDGGVAFKVLFKEVKEIIDFEIKNEFIKKEFDALKEYFEKIFKRKTIEVKAEVKVKGGEVISAIARNEQMEGIDKNLIEEVNLSRVKKIEKEFREQELLTLEDLKEKAKEKKISGVELITDIDELLEEILNYSKSKHYDHVRYLSKQHNADSMRLRFTVKPFSFLFLISNGDNNYYIWETLETQEATYIWSFNREYSLQQQFKEVKQILDEINTTGKQEYLSKAKDNFIKILHDYSPNGFEKWKQELHEKIV